MNDAPRSGSYGCPVPQLAGAGTNSYEMNGAFGEFFQDDFTATGSQFNRNRLPAVDVEELNDAYVPRAELPGMKEEEVNIAFDNNILTMRCEKKAENDRK